MSGAKTLIGSLTFVDIMQPKKSGKRQRRSFKFKPPRMDVPRFLGEDIWCFWGGAHPYLESCIAECAASTPVTTAGVVRFMTFWVQLQSGGSPPSSTISSIRRATPTNSTFSTRRGSFKKGRCACKYSMQVSAERWYIGMGTFEAYHRTVRNVRNLINNLMVLPVIIRASRKKDQRHFRRTRVIFDSLEIKVKLGGLEGLAPISHNASGNVFTSIACFPCQVICRNATIGMPTK